MNTQINPEILAQNIQQFLAQGAMLETIRKDALEQGISEEMWQEAIDVLKKQASTVSDKEASREPTQKKTSFSKRKKWFIRILISFGVIFSLYVLFVGYAFYQYTKTRSYLTWFSEHNFKRKISSTFLSPIEFYYSVKPLLIYDKILVRDKNQPAFKNFLDLKNFLEEKEGEEVYFTLLSIGYDSKSKMFNNKAIYFKEKNNTEYKGKLLSKHMDINYGFWDGDIIPGLIITNDDKEFISLSKLKKVNWDSIFGQIEYDSLGEIWKIIEKEDYDEVLFTLGYYEDMDYIEIAAQNYNRAYFSPNGEIENVTGEEFKKIFSDFTQQREKDFLNHAPEKWKKLYENEAIEILYFKSEINELQNPMEIVEYVNEKLFGEKEIELENLELQFDTTGNLSSASGVLKNNQEFFIDNQKNWMLIANKLNLEKKEDDELRFLYKNQIDDLLETIQYENINKKDLNIKFGIKSIKRENLYKDIKRFEDELEVQLIYQNESQNQLFTFRTNTEQKSAKGEYFEALFPNAVNRTYEKIINNEATREPLFFESKNVDLALLMPDNKSFTSEDIQFIDGRKDEKLIPLKFEMDKKQNEIEKIKNETERKEAEKEFYENTEKAFYKRKELTQSALSNSIISFKLSPQQYYTFLVKAKESKNDFIIYQYISAEFKRANYYVYDNGIVEIKLKSDEEGRVNFLVGKKDEYKLIKVSNQSLQELLEQDSNHDSFSDFYTPFLLQPEEIPEGYELRGAEKLSAFMDDNPGFLKDIALERFLPGVDLSKVKATYGGLYENSEKEDLSLLITQFESAEDLTSEVSNILNIKKDPTRNTIAFYVLEDILIGLDTKDQKIRHELSITLRKRNPFLKSPEITEENEEIANSETDENSCDFFPDKLKNCESFTCEFNHPFSGALMKRKILSEGNDICLYEETMPGDMKMICKYNVEYRTVLADYYNDYFSGKEGSVYSLEGEKVTEPLNVAMKNNICVVNEGSSKKTEKNNDTSQNTDNEYGFEKECETDWDCGNTSNCLAGWCVPEKTSDPKEVEKIKNFIKDNFNIAAPGRCWNYECENCKKIFASSTEYLLTYTGSDSSEKKYPLEDLGDICSECSEDDDCKRGHECNESFKKCVPSGEPIPNLKATAEINGIEIETDKEKYEIGDSAEGILNIDYSGKPFEGMIVIEKEREGYENRDEEWEKVFSEYVRTIKPDITIDSLSLAFSVSDEMRGGGKYTHPGKHKYKIKIFDCETLESYFDKECSDLEIGLGTFDEDISDIEPLIEKNYEIIVGSSSGLSSAEIEKNKQNLMNPDYLLTSSEIPEDFDLMDLEKYPQVSIESNPGYVDGELIQEGLVAELMLFSIDGGYVSMYVDESEQKSFLYLIVKFEGQISSQFSQIQSFEMLGGEFIQQMLDDFKIGDNGVTSTYFMQKDDLLFIINTPNNEINDIFSELSLQQIQNRLGAEKGSYDFYEVVKDDIKIKE